MMKRKLLALAVTGALSSSAVASTFQNPGATLGYGDAGNTHTLFTHFKNPAYLAGDKSGRVWGLGIGLGIDIEYAGAAGIDDNADTLQNSIENIGFKIQSIDPINDSGFYDGYLYQALQNNGFDETNITTLTPQETADVINDTLNLASTDTDAAAEKFISTHQDMNMSFSGTGAIPIVVQTTEWGGFMLGAAMTTGATTGFIRDGQVETDFIGGTPATINEFQDLEVEARLNTAMRFTGFQMTELFLAYGMNLDPYFKLGNGSINAGVRFKMMNAGFNHYLIDFDKVINDEEGDFGDELSDGLEETMTFDDTSTAFGVDIGVQYLANNYLVGMTVENVNSPSFKYNLIDDVAQYAASEGLLDRTITFDPKARLEGAYFSQNRRWTLAGFYDLNKTMSINGLETQKAGVSASYASRLWYAPDLRVGYTNESAGNKLSRIHGGLTVGPVSLDLALNTTSFDEFEDNSIAANLGIELKF